MNADEEALLRQASHPESTPFDYVIVGSGAGGGPLAARLAMSNRRVLLIEAGGDPAEPEDPPAQPTSTDIDTSQAMSPRFKNDPPMREVFAVPAFHAASTEDPQMSWGFSVRHYEKIETQKKDEKYNPDKDPSTSGNPGTGGIFYPRAQAIGGCTAHYAMIIIRPNDADWDDIARYTDDESWRSENMQGYFGKIENCLYYADYESTLHHYLGLLYEGAQWIARKLDPRNQLDPGGHGSKGWQTTSFIDPIVILNIVKDDKTFKGVLLHIILAALSNGPSGKMFLKVLARFQLLRYLDPNVRSLDVPTRDHLSLISIGTDGRRRCGLPDHLKKVRAEHKNNLVIANPFHATRILFKPGEKAPRAVGVEIRRGAHLYAASPWHRIGKSAETIQVFARREVIVCGGAFNTPQLLMLSGVGDSAQLGKWNINGLSGPDGFASGIINLPGVGKNLQDRYEVSIVCEADHAFSTLDRAEFRPGDANDPVLKQWRNQGTGLYATNGGAIAMMFSSAANAQERRDPDFFIFGAPAAFRGYYWGYSRELLYRIKGAGQESRDLWSWVILKAYTKNNQGVVALRSADPLETPDINFHSFDDTDPGGLICKGDVDALCEAVEHMRQINAHVKAFKNGNEVQPGTGRTRDSKELRDWIKHEAWGHHACGTCRMGSDVWRADTRELEDEGAVVDSQFRVHGVENLRIVDTSVFRTIPGYFIVTPTFMISEKAADLLLADTTCYPRELEMAEARAIRERREKAGIKTSHPGPNDEKLPQDTLGLALSGGGIRSATFCLGFLQALAEKGKLREIDIMSSVSGGGYTASFLGRLFSRLHDADHDKAARIERTVANADSPENQWLRYNAQYILGGGRHDSLWDITVILRNLTSVHLWLGVLIFGVFGLLHLWVLNCARLGFLSFACRTEPPVWFTFTLSPWWWLPAALFLLGVLPPSIGYWLTLKTHPGRNGRLWLPFVLWLVLLASAIWGISIPSIVTESTIALVVLLLAWFAQEAASWHITRASDEPAPGTPKVKKPPPNPGVANPAVGTVTVRNRLTRMLGAALFGFVTSVLWVALDTLAPHIADHWFSPAAWSMTGIAPALLLLRGLAASVIKRPAQTSRVTSHGFALQIVLGVVAFVLVFTLVLFVDVLVYQVFRFDPQVGLLCTVASLLVSLVIGSMLSYINLSSLQQAYAQKLTRTFLGAANDARVHPAGVAPPVPVDVPDLGDDIWFDEYHPEAKGGPLHLIGACVNNTVDPLSGNQLRDDKGMPMCAGPLGLSVGRRFHALWKTRDDDATTPRHVAQVTAVTVEPDPNQFHVLADKNDDPVLVERLRLGQWMAISGAAATTGLGRETRLAQSVLLGLFNIRIGYWWDSGIAAGNRPGRYPPDLWRWLKSLPANVFRLHATLLNEWRAYFAGPAERMWYLSDGGHFDDTGVYELIRRRVPFIIAIDATHDPSYQCGPLALLTRQVRFDFQATIEWLDPAAGREVAPYGQPAGWKAFERSGCKPPDCIRNVLDPESIGSYEGLKRDAALNAALARITYADDKQRESWLLLVKPSVTCGLPNDLQTYAARHGDFPNQTTLDQFFDDDQWEAYRMLGRCTGSKLFI